MTAEARKLPEIVLLKFSGGLDIVFHGFDKIDKCKSLVYLHEVYGLTRAATGIAQGYLLSDKCY